jgi:acetyl esterase/lipase
MYDTRLLSAVAAMALPAGCQTAATVPDHAGQADAGMLPAPVYDPHMSRGPVPVILYFHGDQVTDTLDTCDASERALANDTGAIVSAEIHPRPLEVAMLAQKLTEAGVPVVQPTFPGVTHDFFGVGAVVAPPEIAEDFASMRLKALFVAPMPAAAPVGQRVTRRHAG